MDVDAKPIIPEVVANSNVATPATVSQPTVVAAASSNQQNQTATLPQFHLTQSVLPPGGGSKYNQLLALIEELGKDIRPTYTGNRNCTERLKRAIGHARVLTRECINEVEKNARQQP